MAKASAPRIDCHAHVYTQAMPLAGDAWHRPLGEATIDDFLATLARAGVTHGVLAAASLYGEYNDYSLAATRGRANLRTTVMASPATNPDALRRMKADGAVGVRFQWRGKPKPDLSSSDWQAFLARVCDLDWHVELHDDAPRLPPVLTVLDAFPMRVVVDHFGRPDPSLEGFEAVIEAMRRGRTWVKISAAFRLEPPDLATRLLGPLLEAGGPERLLWGSDWPFAAFETRMSYEAALQSYQALVPEAALRDAIDRTGFDFYFNER